MITPEDTKINSRHFFMPQDLNKKGTLFGGALMAEIDKIAAMAAELHAKGTVVTAAVDNLAFKRPIDINEHTIFKAMVNYVGKTSMEIGVRVEAQDPKTKKIEHYCSAYLTFVAVDEMGKPRDLEKIYPQSPEEKRRFKAAQERIKYRKKVRAKQEAKK